MFTTLIIEQNIPYRLHTDVICPNTVKLFFNILGYKEHLELRNLFKIHNFFYVN